MTKLPKPAAHLADSLPLFTEAQMLQFRRDALEAAALVCEEHQYEWTYGSTYADAIRCLQAWGQAGPRLNI